MNTVSAALSAASMFTSLEPVLLSFLVEKYIEAAGTSAQQLERAQTIKSVASELNGAVLGTVSVAELETMALGDLNAKNIPISSQTLISGLLAVITSSVPAAGPLLKAAAAAEASVALTTIIQACAKFGA